MTPKRTVIPLVSGHALDLIKAALTERHRQWLNRLSSGLAARSPAGLGAVLVAWALMILAGSAFAKSTEHWDDMATGATGLAAVGFVVVVAAAVVVGAALLLGVLIALPAAVAAWRGGRLRAAQVALLVAGVTCACAALVGVGVVLWAQRLSPEARNGGDQAYVLTVTGWAVLVAAALATTCAAGIAVLRRLELTERALQAELWLALVMAVGMGVIAAGTIMWWFGARRAAPRLFEAGPGAGSLTAQLVAIVVGMAVALTIAVVGLTSARSRWPRPT